MSLFFLSSETIGRENRKNNTQAKYFCGTYIYLVREKGGKTFMQMAEPLHTFLGHNSLCYNDLRCRFVKHSIA